MWGIEVELFFYVWDTLKKLIYIVLKLKVDHPSVPNFKTSNFKKNYNNFRFFQIWTKNLICRILGLLCPVKKKSPLQIVISDIIQQYRKMLGRYLMFLRVYLTMLASYIDEENTITIFYTVISWICGIFSWVKPVKNTQNNFLKSTFQCRRHGCK